ncbi:uncharacterized protein involved in outer membrane biogenesis [Ereboglobus sp. PH5-5]|uniref:DUF748 domain-containing protein n=1 Tax=unclassified Ereboglobus TaxID=2626932 RepID=UPI002405EC2D|nr:MULTISPECIES: AsmA family protein [unclassified Ereboglobus]MDF9828023.1 uncharacterized protein involved in outer membrane biogenesis [Ereboglobus sp. PH5-10]MDF9832283.1 uncharacterized protein involved in outer membrane biogenesis [Ereboglobus sp. PH5-5]
MSKETPKKKKSLLAKLIIGLVSLVVVVVAAVAIVCIFCLKPIVRSQIEGRTGYTVKIEKLSLNPFTANLVIDGFVITNPASDFKTPGFVDLHALHGKVSVFSLMSDRIVVESATLDLPSVTLVRRANDAPSNAALFAGRLMGESTAPAGKDPETKPAEPSKPVNFLIKKLDVNVGKVVVATEADDGATSSRDYTINYKHSYENITEPKQFMTTDLAKSLLGVGSQLSDLIPGEFGQSVDSVLKGGIKVLDNPEEAASGAVQSLLDKLKSKKKE